MRLLTKDCNSTSFAQEDTTVCCGRGGVGSRGLGTPLPPCLPGLRASGLHPAEELAAALREPSCSSFPCSAAPSPLVQPSFPPPCCMVIKWHHPAPGRLLIILQTSRKVWGVRGSWERWQGRQRVAPCCFYFGLNRRLAFIWFSFARARQAFENRFEHLRVACSGVVGGEKTNPHGALSLNPLQTAYRQPTLLDFEPKLLFT